jgi:hypothetical protein
VRKLIEDHNVFARDHGFDSAVRHCDTYRTRHAATPTRRGHILKVGDHKGDCQVDFDQKGRLWRFLNWKAIHKASEFDRQGKARPTAAWTEEDAIRCAALYSVAMLGRLPAGLSKATAAFKPGPRRGDVSRSGTWTVVWQRTDSNGREFLDDHLFMIIDERVGPLSLTVNLSSQYSSRAVAVEQRRAEALAKAVAPKFMSLSVARDWSRGYRLGDVQASRLAIVNPKRNRFPETWDALIEPGAREARLAWVVILATIPGGPARDGGAKLTDGAIHIWIDAETGEFLGGKF